MTVYYKMNCANIKVRSITHEAKKIIAPGDLSILFSELRSLGMARHDWHCGQCDCLGPDKPVIFLRCSNRIPPGPPENLASAGAGCQIAGN
ncbi:hypothetical protein [Cupriavidus oxalaticus]|uniref:hypothetical protein n=1 Tax=Cupriavidus oxalaticus TaxID=96344 RepID=UPI00317EAC86